MVHKSASEIFTDEMEYKNDKLYLILRGHLYIENELNKLLEGFLPNPEILELYKESFRRKIDLAFALNLIKPKLYDILLGFNELRNKYAHRLKYNISHDEIRNLKNLIAELEGLEELADDIVIGGKKNSIIDLKVIIVAIHSVMDIKANSIKRCENPIFDIKVN